MSAVLERGQPFTILYDLRSCSMPSHSQVGIGKAWGSAHAKSLNRLLQGIAILLSGAISRSMVNMLLGICKPPQPHGLFAEDAAAFAFAHDQCTIVRVWSKKKRACSDADGSESSSRHKGADGALGGGAEMRPTDRGPNQASSTNSVPPKQVPVAQRSTSRVGQTPKVRVQLHEVYSQMQEQKAQAAAHSGSRMMARLAEVEAAKKVRGEIGSTSSMPISTNDQKSRASSSRRSRSLLLRMSECGGVGFFGSHNSSIEVKGG